MVDCESVDEAYAAVVVVVPVSSPVVPVLNSGDAAASQLLALEWHPVLKERFCGRLRTGTAGGLGRDPSRWSWDQWTVASVGRAMDVRRQSLQWRRRPRLPHRCSRGS